MYLICSSEHTDESPATDTPITTLLQATSVVLILFTALSQIFTTDPSAQGHNWKYGQAACGHSIARVP